MKTNKPLEQIDEKNRNYNFETKLNVTLIFEKVSTKVSHDCMWKHDHRGKQLLKIYSNQDKMNKT